MKPLCAYSIEAQKITNEVLADMAVLANVGDDQRQRYFYVVRHSVGMAWQEFILYSSGRRLAAKKSPLLIAAQRMREVKNAITNLSREEHEQLQYGFEYAFSITDTDDLDYVLLDGPQDLIDAIEVAFASAIGRAPQHKKRKKRGPGRNPSTKENWPLHNLVLDLLCDAEFCGKGFKFYKNHDNSLLKALNLLRPFLPEEFAEADWSPGQISSTYQEYRARRRKLILEKKRLLSQIDQLSVSKPGLFRRSRRELGSGRFL
jgi:hypothetical protein